MWSNSCRQLRASHTPTLVEQLFYPHCLCLRTGGLDLTQWACFVSYQDNGWDCWNVCVPEFATHIQARKAKWKILNTPGKKSMLLYSMCDFILNLRLHLWCVCVSAYLHCSLQYVGLIVLHGGKRPLIMVTKTSRSDSHSNKNISFPRAEFINYAFLLQDLYFLRQELECMLNFLLSIRAATPTASPLQLLPRQLIEKSSVAWRILTHIHAHRSHSHTLVMALCTCLFLSVCAFMRVCLHLVSWTILKHSRQCCATPQSFLFILALFSFYLIIVTLK